MNMDIYGHIPPGGSTGDRPRSMIGNKISDMVSQPFDECMKLILTKPRKSFYLFYISSSALFQLLPVIESADPRILPRAKYF